MSDSKLSPEQVADDLYQEFKSRFNALSMEERSFAFKKLYWWLYWNMPNALKASKHEVDAFLRAYEGPGLVPVHMVRPPWIRPPEGGDEFDRGEVGERYDIPL